MSLRLHRRLRALLAALALGLAAPVAALDADPSEPCAAHPFDGGRFTVCVVDLAKHDLRLFWTDETGTPFARPARLPKEIEGRPLLFAMNAGMYDRELAPIGLYVEDGVELKRLNTRDGPGNFHMLPNGVFYVAGGRAGVMTTQDFLAATPDAEIATQSGPMLVIDGRLHPRFLPGSDSLRIRNGVGVRPDGRVLFAISDEAVTFHHFARLFRDALGTPNALYLDGSVSALYAPHLERSDGFRPLGPMIAAFPRGEG